MLSLPAKTFQNTSDSGALLLFMWIGDPVTKPRRNAELHTVWSLDIPLFPAFFWQTVIKKATRHVMSVENFSSYSLYLMEFVFVNRFSSTKKLWTTYNKLLMQYYVGKDFAAWPCIKKLWYGDAMDVIFVFNLLY